MDTVGKDKTTQHLMFSFLRRNSTHLIYQELEEQSLRTGFHSFAGIRLTSSEAKNTNMIPTIVHTFSFLRRNSTHLMCQFRPAPSRCITFSFLRRNSTHLICSLQTRRGFCSKFSFLRRNSTHLMPITNRFEHCAQFRFHSFAGIRLTSSAH